MEKPEAGGSCKPEGAAGGVPKTFLKPIGFFRVLNTKVDRKAKPKLSARHSAFDTSVDSSFDTQL